MDQNSVPQRTDKLSQAEILFHSHMATTRSAPESPGHHLVVGQNPSQTVP